MSIISDDKFANGIVNNAINYYEYTFNTSLRYKMIILLTDDLKNDVMALNHSEIYKNVGDVNGLWIEPDPPHPLPMILIKYQIFNKNPIQALGIAIHELTHAHDFNRFVLDYCNKSWKSIRQNYLFDTIRIWSEYHARVTQIIHMRKLAAISFRDSYTYDEKEIADEMKNCQLQRYIDFAVTDINDNNSDKLRVIIDICARFYAVELYNPDIQIFDYMPKEIYDCYPEIEELYNYLKPLQTYDDITNHLYTLKSMLEFWGI